MFGSLSSLPSSILIKYYFQKNVITPETEVILILTTNNLNLTNCSRVSCLSKLFITYEIIKNGQTFAQQLFLDKICLNHNFWCIDDDKLSKTSDLKEFLLLTANSFKFQLQLLNGFSKDDLITFFMTKLKFSINTTASNEDLLIKNNGYWENTLISVKADHINIYSK